MVVKRDPDATRTKLLEAAYEEIYKNGFRAASLDRILSETDLTKGALYHHFPNKAALGYAVIEELIGGHIRASWIEPLNRPGDPVEALMHVVENVPREKVEMVVMTGCPLNNLAQELSSVDEQFRCKIEAVFDGWRRGIADRLRLGRDEGYIDANVDCDQAAMFFIASFEGAIGMAKNAQDEQVLCACACGLRRYLESLRPRA